MKNQQTFHLDAAESVFFDKELTYIKSKTYDVIRKDLKATQLIPVSSEAGAAAEFIEIRSFDSVGSAKVVSDYSKDFPRVDTFGVARQVKVKSLGDSYGYTIMEIRRAAQVPGTRLDQRRAMAARRSIDELQDTIGWFGDTASGLKGLINADNISEVILANGATGGSKAWSTKTADEKLADIVALITAAPESTNGKEVPDTLILPMAMYNDLAYTPYGDDRSKTILRFITDNYRTITRIEWVQELVGAGAGGSNRMMAYTRSLDKLSLEIPQPFEQMPAQLIGMEYTVNCHQRTAGVIIYYPASVVFADGI